MRDDRPGATGRRLLVAVLVAAGLLGSATTAHGGTTPPSVSDLEVAAATVADGVLSMTGRVRARDAGSGMDRVVVIAMRPDGRRDQDRVVGQVVVQPDFPGQAVLDAAWTVRAPDPDETTLALRLAAFDRDGNITVLDTADLDAAGLPAVVDVDGVDRPPGPVAPPSPDPGGPGDDRDTTAPTIDGFRLDGTTIHEDETGETVVWLEGTVAASDAGVGVHRVVVGAHDEHGHGLGSGIAQPRQVGASSMVAAWAFPVLRPVEHERLPARGFLRLTGYDTAGNVIALDVEDLVDRGWPGVVELVAGDTPPVPAPEPTDPGEPAPPPDPGEPQPGAPQPGAPQPGDPQPGDPQPGDPEPTPGPDPRSPFVEPPSVGGVERLSGSDRTATAARIAAAGWPDGADEVVVATGRAFPDALAAAPFAARRGAPVLLTVGDAAGLVEHVRALGAGRATIVGGVAAVDAGQVTALRDAGVAVARTSGSDRYATATALTSAWSPAGSETGLDEAAWDGTVWVASGTSSADALAAGAAAARRGDPLLLTAPSALPAATRGELERLAPRRIVLVGGTGAVSGRVAHELADVALVQRVAGPDRWATAVAVARVGWASDVAAPPNRGIGNDRALLAEGSGFADAVAGAPLAAGGWGPVLLSATDTLPAATRAALAEQAADGGLTGVTLLGGRSALASDVASEVASLLR